MIYSVIMKSQKVRIMQNGKVNIPGSKKLRFTMEDYDNLPAEYRKFLMYAPFNAGISADSMKLPIEDMRENAEKYIKELAFRTYGPEYPIDILKAWF